MNARTERAVNFENLDARIVENRALDQKIWAYEVLGGKVVISRGFCGILEGLGPICN
jgi:hypothetical protein